MKYGGSGKTARCTDAAQPDAGRSPRAPCSGLPASVEGGQAVTRRGAGAGAGPVPFLRGSVAALTFESSSRCALGISTRLPG